MSGDDGTAASSVQRQNRALTAKAAFKAIKRLKGECNRAWLQSAVSGSSRLNIVGRGGHTSGRDSRPLRRCHGPKGG